MIKRLFCFLSLCSVLSSGVDLTVNHESDGQVSLNLSTLVEQEQYVTPTSQGTLSKEQLLESSKNVNTWYAARGYTDEAWMKFNQDNSNHAIKLVVGAASNNPTTAGIHVDHVPSGFVAQQLSWQMKLTGQWGSYNDFGTFTFNVFGVGENNQLVQLSTGTDATISPVGGVSASNYTDYTVTLSGDSGQFESYVVYAQLTKTTGTSKGVGLFLKDIQLVGVVPEPACIGLLAAGLAGICCRRTRCGIKL